MTRSKLAYERKKRGLACSDHPLSASFRRQSSELLFGGGLFFGLGLRGRCCLDLPEIRVSLHPGVRGIAHSPAGLEEVRLAGLNRRRLQLAALLPSLFAHRGHELFIPLPAL